MRQRLILSISFLIVLSFVKAQELPSSTVQQLESLAELSENETEDDTFLQQLTFYKNRPLNLNEAGADDLQVFPFLTALHIQNFLAYRRVAGELISIYELQSIPAWDLLTIRKLLPFVTVLQRVNLSNSLRQRFKGGEHYLLFRTSRVLEKAKGYDPSLNDPYLGNRDHLLLRYQYKRGNLLQYGFTADKDAGEEFFRGGQSKGFDFYSAHVFVRNLGSIKAIAVGDFSVNLGQGLVQWQSLAFLRGAEVASIKRMAPVLKPYSAAGEFNFNRGAGMTIQKGRTEATVFASIRKIDANMAFDTTGQKIITSFLSSGLHRTVSEMAKKSNTEQTSLGGNISWKHKMLHLGFNAVYHSFSQPVQKRSEPYNLFALTGSSALNMSTDYSFTFKNLHFFGEAAVDKDYNMAILNGALASLDPKVDVSLLHRYYKKDYVTVYGNAFSENTLPANESGLYFGLRLRPSEKVNLNAYSDIYQFPWLKYRTDAPSVGRDFLVQLSYQPSKQMEVYTRYRNERKAINARGDGPGTNEVSARLKQQWRAHITYNISRRLTWQSRMEVAWYDQGGPNEEEGFLFFTGASYKAGNRLSANGRVVFFETTGFNSRIYTYENDVLYSFSTPFYNGSGLRYYFNLNYDVSKYLSLWLKAAQTVYKDQLTTGSGKDELSGNSKSELRLQALLQF